jgi:LysM repeat protein
VRAVAASTPPRAQPDRAVSAARQHTVRAGQTLSGIARQYGVSVAALQQANGLSGTDIRAGQTLSIPGPGLRKVALRTHTVAAGDTLSGIARRYGVSTADLARANGLTDKHRIRPGQTLTIPG